jgi:hypothetical protein
VRGAAQVVPVLADDRPGVVQQPGAEALVHPRPRDVAGAVVGAEPLAEDVLDVVELLARERAAVDERALERRDPPGHGGGGMVVDVAGHSLTR